VLNPCWPTAIQHTIYLRNDLHKIGHKSRFAGSHRSAAWITLGMVFLTLLIYRGAQQNTGVIPYPHAWAFASWVVAQILPPWDATSSTSPISTACAATRFSWSRPSRRKRRRCLEDDLIVKAMQSLF
jgi:hypothetical protein